MTQQELDELQAEYRGWHLWLTDCGSPMATRKRKLSDDEIRAGLWRTLMGGRHEPPLREQLEEQTTAERTRAEQAQAVCP